MPSCRQYGAYKDSKIFGVRRHLNDNLEQVLYNSVIKIRSKIINAYNIFLGTFISTFHLNLATQNR
jgi:hypothetical protein